MDEHHHHDHHHHHHAHKDRRLSAQTSLAAVLLLSVSYMVAEIIGGIRSGSLALLADAGHMAIDSAAIALSLFAAWIAQRPATPDKTYGYYRAEILAALINGATLIMVAIWIFYEAWERFNLARPIRGDLMTGIASGGLIVNFISLLLVHRHEGHNLNARGVWLHLISDTLGSVSAIVAGFMVWKLGWRIADPIISVLISLFILWGAWRLVRECVDVLLEAVPKGIDVSDIKKSIGNLSGVREVHDLHVWNMTSGVPLLTVHVAVGQGVESGEMLRRINDLLVEKFRITHTTVQIEPETYAAPEECCTILKP